jgi:hypothetical protein
MYLSLVQYPVALTAAHAHKQRLLTLSMRAGLGGIKTGTRFICTYGGAVIFGQTNEKTQKHYTVLIERCCSK